MHYKYYKNIISSLDRAQVIWTLARAQSKLSSSWKNLTQTQSEYGK